MGTGANVTAGSLPRDMRIRVWVYSAMILAMVVATVLG